MKTTNEKPTDSSELFAVALRISSDPFCRLWSDGVILLKAGEVWTRLSNGEPLELTKFKLHGYFGTEAAARAFKNR